MLEIHCRVFQLHRHSQHLSEKGVHNRNECCEVVDDILNTKESRSMYENHPLLKGIILHKKGEEELNIVV